MQVGPDAKIYLSIYFAGFLSVINDPDVLGTGCNFVANRVNLAGKTASIGLPNAFVNSIDVLPIKLLSFTVAGRNNDVDLSWKTASEISSSHFEIQYSVNGINWTVLDRVTGAGTSSILNCYDYVHIGCAQLGSDILYYRLKQIDYDGQFTFSNIQSAWLNDQKKLSLIIQGKTLFIKGEGLTNFFIYNTMGELVGKKTDVQVLADEVRYDLGNLSRGLYIIGFQDGRSSKLIIQK